jgi:asparagine synthase (glutamine-hydrolysing)
MCGIAGTINWGDGETLARMVQVQSHRGPDDSGVWEKYFPQGGHIGLGSARLSIIDLSAAGHMPMATPDQKLWITYNGEIYNFRQLRRELEAKGHNFRSNTDTEVVLRLYQQEGAESVKRLDGMFAFGIVDLRDSTPTLFLARDHFGVKPLYYIRQGDQFAFASEIKALLQLPDVKVEIAPAALQQYLTFLWVPGPRTMFRDIHKLAPGHFAIIRNGEMKPAQYWDLTFPSKDAQYSFPQAELVEGIRERLRASVERQLVSDVPLGAFLSAGMDSSSIVAMMAQAGKGSVQTYTIAFPKKYRVGEPTLDDPRVAEKVAQRFGCQHQEIVVEPDAAALLPKLIWHLDEPIADPAVITAYLVCREARKTVTVLLSGVGGDELFAGYRKHVAAHWAGVYHILPAWLRRGVVEPTLLSLPAMRGTPLKGMLRLMKKMARSGSLSPQDAFLMNCTYLDDGQRAQLLAHGNGDGAHPWQYHRSLFEKVADADFLNQMLYLDTKTFMPSLNLTYNDKMSMASSVEVRVPFLDRELAEFVAWNVPPHAKLQGTLNPVTKYILREAMRDLLPPEVLNQPKAGFGAPVDYWLAYDLREMTDDLLAESQIKRRGLFRPEAVESMVREHRRGERDWSMQIWQLLTLELWMQTFVDRSLIGSSHHALPPLTAVPN